MLRCRWVAAGLVLAAGAAARAADASPDAAATVTPAPLLSSGLVELKRQNTARGTPEETTKTELKFDFFPREGALALIRVELPFPDAKTSFAGSPFDPDFGDAKARIGFRAVEIGGRPTTSFLEITFPTADPESQGTGKYQLSAGARMVFAQPPGGESIGAPKQVLSVQLQQVVSFAGDAARDDINRTKVEIEWRDTWADRHYLKATAKPSYDWIAKKSGAVLEVEGGAWLDPRFTVAMMGGTRLWGEGAAGTYSRRVELKLVCRY